ncbi:TPA: iron(III) transporter permease, partial [Escherichia coli]
FTDAMKELPVTLLYAEAARGTFEEGAISALMIVLAGTFPVILFVPAERLKSED